MPNHRRNRINEAMRQELSLILREVKDPRLCGGLITVTGSQVTPDLKYAKVFYSALAPEGDDLDEIAKALKNASPFIRRRLAETLNLRITPELTFIYDSSLSQSAKIESILREIRQDKPAGGTDGEITDEDE